MENLKCLVDFCDQNHIAHVCKICDNLNSDHLARECPIGITMYHGIRVTNITQLLKEGLKPTRIGKLGQGIYFTDFHSAIESSKTTGVGEGSVVVKCRVNPASCSILQKAKRIGAMDTDVWCLKESKKYRIMGLYLVEGNIVGDITLPRGQIVIRNACYYNGKIKEGTQYSEENEDF